MNEPLLDKIKEHLPEWKRSTVKNLLILIVCILQRETVCLYKFRGQIGAVCDKASTKPSSNYKRAIRFFQDHALGKLWVDILAVGFQLLRLKSEYLVLDGCSWQYGQHKIHLLMLSVVYKGVAIPIYWEDLAKKGCSNIEERITLIQQASHKLNLSGKTLLADREYIGVDWFKYLISNEINFIVRLKKKSYKQFVDQAPGMKYSAMEKKVMRSKKAGKVVSKSFELDGLPAKILMVKNLGRNSKDPIIYLITNLDTSAKKIASAYFIRWKIEVCFKHMKSNGFDLEALNFRCRSKARLMIAMVVFAYTISVLEGMKEYDKIPTKQYTDGSCYKQVSIFRQGLDKLNCLCGNFKSFCLYLTEKLTELRGAYRSPHSIFVQ